MITSGIKYALKLKRSPKEFNPGALAYA